MHNWWSIEGIRICDWTFEQVVMCTLSGKKHPPIYLLGVISITACQSVIMVIEEGI